jgi:hypothetical protein
MYAVVCSADVWGGTTEHMPYKPYKRTYVGQLDIFYFLEYPLGNTWKYEIPVGPLCKDHWTYARVAGRPLLYQRVGGELSL